MDVNHQDFQGLLELLPRDRKDGEKRKKKRGNNIKNITTIPL